MAGTNPYIEKAEFELPQQNYDVTFMPMQNKVEIFSEKISTKSEGLPGSILDAALAAGIDLDHSCGGVCACSTCHVIVAEDWYERLGPISEEEEDMLDMAYDLTKTSRLGCQIPFTGDLDGLKVTIAAED